LHANELTAEALRLAIEDAAASRRGLEVEVAASACTRPVLAQIRFGHLAPTASAGALDIHVQLEPLRGSPVSEFWIANGAVQHGSTGPIRYASDSQHLFGVIEMDEREHGGIVAAAATAYEAMAEFQRHCAFPHLLRMWNYLDDINAGDGDDERYRQFCVGRSRGLRDLNAAGFPAATAIGHQHTTGRLQVFWLAARTPGTAVENPRQISAYRYPRVHGPASPTFARATLAGDRTLLISGTASIVGHSSVHADDVVAQVDETVRNMTALRALALQQTPHRRTLLKVYVRHPADVETIASRLRAVLPPELAAHEVIYLAADICRRELLLEIEGIQIPT
jgi:chorismate lyase/3-hydroxybenzoate synthase